MSQSPNFATVDNMLVILRQISINAIIALAATLVILTAGIDLSVGSVAALSGTVMILLLDSTAIPLPLAIALGLAVGAAAGLINGVATALGGIPPFIVTLGMLSAARGVARGLTESRTVRYDSAFLDWLGNGKVAQIPVPVMVTALWFLICLYLLQQTKFGRHVLAVGGNKEAARFSGVPIQKVLISVYVISGFAAALAGVILSARLSTAQPNAGAGFELDAIAAVVLGGTSLAGGKGRLTGTLFGALINWFHRQRLNHHSGGQFMATGGQGRGDRGGRVH